MYHSDRRIKSMKKKLSYIYFSLLVLILMMITSWIVTIQKSEVPYVDQWTRPLVQTVADTGLYTAARWITNLGSESFLIPFTIVMGLILTVMLRDWLPAL